MDLLLLLLLPSWMVVDAGATDGRHSVGLASSRQHYLTCYHAKPKLQRLKRVVSKQYDQASSHAFTGFTVVGMTYVFVNQLGSNRDDDHHDDCDWDGAGCDGLDSE